MGHVNNLKLWMMLFSMTPDAQQRALTQLCFELGNVTQAVPRADCEVLSTDMMKAESREVLHVTTRRTRPTKKQYSPSFDRTMGLSAIDPTTTATEGFLALVPTPACLTSAVLGQRKRQRTAITQKQRVQRQVTASNQRAAFTEGRALQAVAPRVHLATLPFDFDAGRNLFTALLTWVRSDDSFAWLRMLLSPAPSVVSGVRPAIVWILERHLTQVSEDGLTPQMFDGQATAIGVVPTHDRKTVGKAVSSLRLVR